MANYASGALELTGDFSACGGSLEVFLLVKSSLSRIMTLARKSTVAVSAFLFAVQKVRSKWLICLFPQISWCFEIILIPATVPSLAVFIKAAAGRTEIVKCIKI